MNILNLQANYPKLISYMEENSYSSLYISKVEWEVKRILSEVNTKNWTSYADVYQEYTQKSSSSSYLRTKRTFLGLIEHFDVHGLFPDGRRRQKIVKQGQYHLLVQEFQTVIDHYCAIERDRGKKEETIYTEHRSAASFLLALQEKGIDSIDKITEETVLSVFISPTGVLLRSCSYKKNVAAVFKAYRSYFPEKADRVLSFLPNLRETRKNIQYLTLEEISRLKETLADKETLLSLRDKAIGILALYTGMRSCDIAGLTMDSIDWKNDSISICQQKTETPLELPLTVNVGNAVYDYIELERPKSVSEYIFLSENRPYSRLKSGSLGNISNRIFIAANIRQAADDRRGFHIFRHHLATKLLGNGVAQPIISKLIGHTAPNSLETYLSADFKHLKECALSIEKFLVKDEVFSDE